MNETVVPEGLMALGARLAAAREARGLTVESAADKLHCDPALVRLLDAGRFAEVGGAAVYARGHLRRYAELIGESPEDVTRQWQELASAQIGQPDLTAIPKAERRPSDPRGALRIAGLVGGVLLFVALLAWVLRSAGPPAAPATVEVPLGPAVAGPEPAVAAPPAAAPSSPDAGPGTVAAAPAAGTEPPAMVGAEATVPPAAAVEATAAPQAPEAAASPAIELRLLAQGASWFEVYDRDGRQLTFGLVNANGTRVVRGLPPLRVVIGNVPAVRLEVQGRAAAIPSDLVRSRAALLRVAADGSIVPVP